MALEIGLAVPHDIDLVMRIIAECRDDMKRKGIEQWPDWYPEREKFADAVSKKELFVARVAGKIAACVVLNHSQGMEYSSVLWEINDPNPLVVHRLAVIPAMQGSGIAAEMMAFAERHAREKGAKSIRLDTYGGNTASNRFYGKLGYRRAGSIHLPMMPKEYYCYEKEL